MDCKRCGKRISSKMQWFEIGWGQAIGYCKTCRNEFVKAVEDGAIVIDKYISSTVTPPVHYHIIWYGGERHIFYNLNQVQAIVKARKIAKKEGIKTIIFCYCLHNNVWFLNDYLNAHPKIKRAVLKAEKSIFNRIILKIRNL